MKKCIILFLLLFSKHISNAQQMDIALNLNDCINCVKYFKDLEPNRVRFILPIDYQEDSTHIIKKYFDNNKVNIVYSDSFS